MHPWQLRLGPTKEAFLQVTMVLCNTALETNFWLPWPGLAIALCAVCILHPVFCACHLMSCAPLLAREQQCRDCIAGKMQHNQVMPLYEACGCLSSVLPFVPLFTALRYALCVMSAVTCLSCVLQCVASGIFGQVQQRCSLHLTC